MEKKLKIMTYNICHCLDFRKNSKPAWGVESNIKIDETAEFIKNSNADIVGLNEVYNAETGMLARQAEKLGKLTGYTAYSFGKALSLDDGDYGNAFLSKYKIKETNTYIIPIPTESERRPDENGYYEPRVILKNVVDIGDVDISVYVTHFGLNLLEKERMVDKLIELIENDKNPCVLMGDFNSEPQAAELKPLFDRLQSVAKVCNNNQKTFATYGDEKQIDYIFVSKEFEIKSFERINFILSDHYPCVTDVVLKY